MMATPSDLEPLLEWDDIQGNVLGGFNKDHQTLLGLSFGGNAGNAKRFLSNIQGRITALREVVLFKAERRRKIVEYGVEPRDMPATWISAAFSFEGLKLLSRESEVFTDAEFRAGLPKSSSRLGDLGESYRTWKIGAPDNVPDLFLIVSADRDTDCHAAVEAISAAATSYDLTETYREEGHDPSFYSSGGTKFDRGREHFGFKDGVSQPGVRGVLPTGEYLTTRVLPPGDDDSGPEFSSPGKPLICTGQFVLGYAQQLDTFPRQAGPKHILGDQPGAMAPLWARNGSFLVFRRLHQDVPAFRRFVAAEAARLADPTMPANRIAALLVGRWPSGAPIIRTSLVDDVSQATEPNINAFGFGDDNEALGLPNDSRGRICPMAAHIRKVNPRDENTDQGSASASLIRRVLRRGIPYGPPLAPGVDDPVNTDRGLLFLSYQTSISQQFEFLCSQWMNSAMLPRNPSAIIEGLGFDMVVGQSSTTARNRFAYLPNTTAQQRLSTDAFLPRDWVVATGGGYFFTPSISAIRSILSS